MGGRSVKASSNMRRKRQLGFTTKPARLPRSLAQRAKRQRRFILQPRVGARHERLPWEGVPTAHRPQRGCIPTASGADATPLGLDAFFDRCPRVARASQPWAGGWNAVGVRSHVTQNAFGVRVRQSAVTSKRQPRSITKSASQPRFITQRANRQPRFITKPASRPHFITQRAKRQRRFIFQPRVGARHERLPWESVPIAHQPQRGCIPAASGADATPLGLDAFFGRYPRVARASQPWAGGWNAVGVRSHVTLNAVGVRFRPSAVNAVGVQSGTNIARP